MGRLPMTIALIGIVSPVAAGQRSVKQSLVEAPWNA